MQLDCYVICLVTWTFRLG